MAKYILNRTNNGPKVVNCAVLDENCLANTYTVRFENGMIRDVDKRRVSQLDRLDEAVLDRLKEFAAKLWDNIVKVGKYVYTTVKGRLITAVSPINTMIAAKQVNGLTFIPSSTVADLAEEQGIVAEEVIDEPEEEDEEFIKDANAYWKEVIKGFSYESPIGNPAYDGVYYESKKDNYSREQRINEARSTDISLKHKAFHNVGTHELMQMLLQQYNQYMTGEAMNPNTRPIPYCIWGAPGIGKTQIINSLIDLLRDTGVDANIISINAMSMRKDDWALPGQRTTYKDAINADGEKIKLSIDTAVELPKSWLPAWDPNDVDEENGITEEMLDDIANGGDGTGTGRGGFFFIDELSRIAPDVNNVIMVLLQSRTFQGKNLGSKWMFVAAANRSTDMGENAAYFKWDSAQTGRFTHVNFVPTFDEWLEWAESPIRGTDTPHIEPMIVEFLKEHENVWHNPGMFNKEDEKDKVSRTLYPGPRGWENATKEIRGRQGAASDMLAKAYAALGLKTEPRDLSPKEISDILSHHVGNQAATMFRGWAGFDAVFTSTIAKSVWTQGEKAKIPFRPNSVTIQAALDKILSNYPNANKVAVPGTTMKRVPITAQQLENVVNYLITCVDKVDETDGSAKDPILRTVEGQLVVKLVAAPFHLDLTNPNSKDAQTFSGAIKILDDRMGKTEDTLMNG